MPRQKSKRAISYHPPCCHFHPQKEIQEQAIHLLAEEVEALYLMELMELYQEEAALKMGVSRPTFTRIIKSARHKVALAILGGHSLHLEDTKKNYVVALCSESETSPYISLSPRSRYIHFFTLENHQISKHHYVENPLLEEPNAKPSLLLNELFINQHVNLFITKTIGQGFKSILATEGISVLLKEAIIDEEIKALW